MARLAIILAGLVVLSGCASTKQEYVSAEIPQYCHTTEDIVVENGATVSSRTRVECTDDMIKKHFYPRSGMAPNCGEFNYWMKIGGHDVQRKGVSCQKPDGTWEIVNTGIGY